MRRNRMVWAFPAVLTAAVCVSCRAVSTLPDEERNIKVVYEWESSPAQRHGPSYGDLPYGPRPADRYIKHSVACWRENADGGKAAEAAQWLKQRAGSRVADLKDALETLYPGFRLEPAPLEDPSERTTREYGYELAPVCVDDAVVGRREGEVTVTCRQDQWAPWDATAHLRERMKREHAYLGDRAVIGPYRWTRDIREHHQLSRWFGTGGRRGFGGHVTFLSGGLNGGYPSLKEARDTIRRKLNANVLSARPCHGQYVFTHIEKELSWPPFSGFTAASDVVTYPVVRLFRGGPYRRTVSYHRAAWLTEDGRIGLVEGYGRLPKAVVEYYLDLHPSVVTKDDSDPPFQQPDASPP